MNPAWRRLGLLLLLVVPAAAAAALTTSNRFERLSSDFERTRELLRDPGLAAAIVENGRVVCVAVSWKRSAPRMAALAALLLLGAISCWLWDTDYFP